MANVTENVSAEQLATLSAGSRRCELVRGELRMMSPAGGRHGRIAGKLFLRIGNIVEQHDLGQIFAAETGFLLERNPDTVRAPDVSFVSHERLGEFTDYTGYLPLAPDLVAEVVSPNDTSSEVEEKAISWISAGVRIVLIVDPQTKTIRVYRSTSEVQIYHEDSDLTLHEVLPQLTINLRNLFA